MIVVRDIFQLHFGKAKEAIGLIREGTALQRRTGQDSWRVLTDVVGDYYTLVLESTHESLNAYEQSMSEMSDPEWQAWYARFTPLVRQGRREILRVVE